MAGIVKKTAKRYSYSIGLEEELFIVDKQTRRLSDKVSPKLLKICQDRYPDQIIPEFLNAQIEIITKPCISLAQVANQLAGMRQCLIATTEKVGLAPIAASTHPFAHWSDTQPNQSQRSKYLINNVQAPARRLLAGGMHIHIGFNSDRQRLNFFNKIRWYLSHLLALSTSSPFWQGIDTGLNSFRVSVVDALPRSGMPQYFSSMEEYKTYIHMLTNIGVIQNAREIWWDVRLSCRYPTIEIRITDVCTQLRDAIAIAALVLCLLRYFEHASEPHDSKNNRIQENQNLSTLYAKENRWRAQRFNLAAASFIDYQQEKLISCQQLMTDLVRKLQVYAAEIDCESELADLLLIIDRGTSADRQRQCFLDAKAKGANDKRALVAVVDYLIHETSDFSLYCP